MKRLNHYYHFIKDGNSKTKFISYNNTSGYLRIELLRNKKNELVVYLSDNDYTKSNVVNELKLIGKNGHISRVMKCNQNPTFAHGDFIHSNDLFLFIFNDELTEFELLIAEGRKFEKNIYLNMLLDGILDDEITNFRENTFGNNLAA